MKILNNILDSLKEKFSKNFKISINNNDHSKIFIFDNNDVEWLMIGSYNFLSFYPSNNIDDMDRGETIMLTNNKNAIKICKDKILKACEND